jgi:choice-of-anchor A domain-containing protein
MTTAHQPLTALFSLFILAISAGATGFGPLSRPGFDSSAFIVVTPGISSNLDTGNIDPDSDTGGRGAVFGSYTGNEYQIFSQYSSVPNPYAENYALIVNGNIVTNLFTAGNGGTPAQTVWVGGTYSPGDFISPQPAVVQTSPLSDFDFYSARTSLDNLSGNTPVKYSAAVTVTPRSNGTNYVLTAAGTGLLVYNVDYSYFTNRNLALEVDVVSGQSVIVNVTGAPVSLTLSKQTVIRYNGALVNANTTSGVPVLFNLPEVTSFSTRKGAINGSILAPFGTFVSPGRTVDGRIFVAAVNGPEEAQDQYDNGRLPSFVATPEPATCILFGTGLIGLRLMRGKSGARPVVT